MGKRNKTSEYLKDLEPPRIRLSGSSAGLPGLSERARAERERPQVEPEWEDMGIGEGDHVRHRNGFRADDVPFSCRLFGCRFHCVYWGVGIEPIGFPWTQKIMVCTRCWAVEYQEGLSDYEGTKPTEWHINKAVPGIERKHFFDDR